MGRESYPLGIVQGIEIWSFFQMHKLESVLKNCYIAMIRICETYIECS